MFKEIIVKHARVHNLKNISLTLKNREFIVITGVSGSGKSSLAFDTLYAEGERRYIQALPLFARRFLHPPPQPDVDAITGLSPTVAIQQRALSASPRSTVGTLTEIYDHLRLLFARFATPYCPASQLPVGAQSKERIISSVQKIQASGALWVLAPIARDKLGSFKQEMQHFVRQGFIRARLDHEVIDCHEANLDPEKRHNIDLVVDRCTNTPDNASRLAEAVTLALEYGSGSLLIWDKSANKEHYFSMNAFSLETGLSYPPLEPRDFSFNSSIGMCSSCHGLGSILGEPCPNCKGSRLKPYPSAARFSDKRLQELTSLSSDALALFFKGLSLSSPEKEMVAPLVEEITKRLGFLHDVGLSYLSLDRPLPTLSGGEAQRVRLAEHLGAPLVGLTYVLDEPSIGLHPIDQQRLLQTLKRVRDAGNTLIVVEHDFETMLAADHIVEIGPGAGIEGGRVLFNGSLAEFLPFDSLTADYLTGRRSLAPPQVRRTPTEEILRLTGACNHNLQQVTLSIPLGLFVAVTGVSGSGKSSLLNDTLLPALKNHLEDKSLPTGAHAKIEGLEYINQVLAIDQTPIIGSSRSNPATYIKALQEIRYLFSQLPEALQKGLTLSHFSFNTLEGACPQCHGLGMQEIDMEFLETKSLTCPLCEGKRFNAKSLSVLYKGKSISDVLALTVKEAYAFFAPISSLQQKLLPLIEVGIGYLTLDQNLHTLSGGEAQRLKLAKELLTSPSKKCLYLLDEPTTGLHTHDIQAFLSILYRLLSLGHTVVIIEHNMEVVKVADWVIDMGPGAGPLGGKIVGEGTPEQLSLLQTPTGKALYALYHPQPLKINPSPPEIAPPPLRVVGAAYPPLQSVDVEIPRYGITLCRGIAGSGKTPLALNTFYAEGYRRYLESLPLQVRSFLNPQPAPPFEKIEGLSPAVAIEQKRGHDHPRSTVGTLTEIYDHLRLLFAYAGQLPQESRSQVITAADIREQILAEFREKKIRLLAPLSLKEGQTWEDLLSSLRQKGFLNISIENIVHSLDDPLPPGVPSAVVIDQFTLLPRNEKRLEEAIYAATSFVGRLLVYLPEEKVEREFSLNLSSTQQHFAPNFFSFNNPSGMCPGCRGLGFITLNGEKRECIACRGSRLNATASEVELEGRTLPQLIKLPVTGLLDYMQSLKFSSYSLLQESLDRIQGSLTQLIELGLGSLNLGRATAHLSRGEVQRLWVARYLGIGLRDILYVLDHPSIGLDPANIAILCKAMRELQEAGNTLLLIENDPQMAEQATHILLLGERGKILAESGPFASPAPSLPSRAKRKPTETLTLENQKLYSGSFITAHFGIAVLNCLTGPSGSGKTTFLEEVLYPAIKAQERPLYYIDSRPLSQSSRSDVGSFLRILPYIRAFYASLGQAKTTGLQPKHFSYNHKQGMCTQCRGLGYIKVNLAFLPAVKVTCDQCQGLRLNALSLNVRYQGKNFGQVLQMTLQEAYDLFTLLPKARALLAAAIEQSMEYLLLGQEISTLSLSEGQKLKLATLFGPQPALPAFYLLDEPTAALHPTEIEQLIDKLHTLVEKGHTIIATEHDPLFIQNADLTIQL